MRSENVYLDNYFYDEALKKYTSVVKSNMKFETETISTKESLGYVLCNAVYAKVSSPNFTASAMDGIAIDYVKTLEATETNHVVLTKNIDYMEVDTGDYIESKYNAVIMIENLIKLSDDTVKITEPVGFFQNIRSMGEDIVKTEMILPSFHKIRPVDVGALIAGGIQYVEVIKPFKIGIMPTGTEIVDVSKKSFEVGDIIDSNSYMLKALVEEMGFYANVNKIVKDDYNLLKENIINLTNDNDIVFINAGSSAGREDFTKDILNEIGEVILHGIAIKPGKPVILAIVNNKMVVGIPGYPVSCYIIFEKVIKPILNNLLKKYVDENVLNVTLTKKIYSSLKHLEFVRVKVGFVNNKWVATPLARGAGVSMSLVECDGILEIPKNTEGYNEGEIVQVKLNKSKEHLKNKIVCIGSHDLLINVIRDVLIQKDFNFNISSTNTGSFGGILALKNKECVLAPIHILDENDGTYNINVVKKYFKGEKMALIRGVGRKQGLVVQKNNPKQIKNIKDVTSLKYINRQQGSGTYILFNYLLKQNGIKRDDVTGFDFNVPTHFDVAVNVKNDIADCGLAIYSVAKALDLDFINVANEQYDFLIRADDLKNENVKKFIEVLKSDFIKNQLLEIGGYDLNDIGEVIFID